MKFSVRYHDFSNQSKYYRLRYINITYNYYLQRGQVLLQKRHTITLKSEYSKVKQKRKSWLVIPCSLGILQRLVM